MMTVHAPYFLSEAEAYHLYADGDAAHDFDHVLRVTRMAGQIAQAESADLAVVQAAALLHDVPAPGSARGDHHMAAAAFARHFLTTRGISPVRIENVVHCIQAHRFRDRTIQPQTLEARCLYDADKLDSIGAIGVARSFAHAGAHGNRLWSEPWPGIPRQAARPAGRDYTPVHEFVYKLQQVMANLYTQTARDIGQQRHQFMVAFFSQLDMEMAEYGLGREQEEDRA